jgi:hypothetical protein
MEEIVNKVANSGLVTFDLEKYFDESDRTEFDMKEHLFQGLILKEKDFRQFVKEEDWSKYEGQNVALYCSADAIVPTWAYMLVANKMEPFANDIFYGTPQELEKVLYVRALEKVDPKEFADQRVVIKGCSGKAVPESAYVEITKLLTPHVKSLFYGEPCSTVPIYKRRPTK